MQGTLNHRLVDVKKLIWRELQVCTQMRALIAVTIELFAVIHHKTIDPMCAESFALAGFKMRNIERNCSTHSINHLADKSLTYTQTKAFKRK